MASSNPSMAIIVRANIESLRKSLAEGGTAIQATTAQMQKLASSLDGSKLEQRAHNIVAAINEVGGATKLTDAEAKRHLTTLDAWIEKGNRMGKEIPPDILKTRDALVRVNEEVKTLPPQMSKVSEAAGLMKGALGALGVSMSIGAVVAFGKSVFDAASEIGDTASKLGISVEAMQGFKFAAEQSGSSIDAVGASLNKMNLTLAKGGDSTIDALKSAGLNFETIRAMKPEDAFLAITDAIQKIKDPMEQVRVGTALMGKGFSDILPAIKDGFRDVSDSAVKMSAETVAKLKAAQDAWASLGTSVTVITGTMIADTMSWTSQATSSIGAFSTFLFDVATKGSIAAVAAQKDAAKSAAAGKAASDQFERETAVVPKLVTSLDALAAGHAKATKAVRDHGEAFVFVGPKLEAFGVAIDNNMIPQVQALAFNIEMVAPKVQAFGVAVTNGLPKDTFKILGDSITMIPPKVQRATHEVGQLAAAMFQLGAGISSIGGQMGGSKGQSVSGLGSLVGMFAQVSDAAKKSGGNFGEVGASWSKAEGLMGKASVGMSAGMSVVSGAMSVWSSTADDGTKKAGAFHGAMAGAKAGAMFGPYGMAVGAAAGAIVGLIHTLSSGRRAVEDFGKNFGGLDNLRQEMLALGDEGERLWIKLTQGTKKGDKAGAQKVIDEITAALERQKQKTAEVAAASEAAAAAAAAEAEERQAAIDAITAKYAEQLSALDSEYKSLSESVGKEAEEAVMGVQETQERARMEQIELEKAQIEARKAAEIAGNDERSKAMLEAAKVADSEIRRIFADPMRIPIEFVYPDGTTSAPGSSSRGAASTARTTAAASRAGSRASATYVTSVIQLDGREVARSTARHLPGILQGV